MTGAVVVALFGAMSLVIAGELVSFSCELSWLKVSLSIGMIMSRRRFTWSALTKASCVCKRTCGQYLD